MFEKDLYIAKKNNVTTDAYGNNVSTFYTPTKYRFNYQPVSGSMENLEYGDKVSNYYRAFIPIRFLGTIKAGDRAYLIDGDNLNIQNAATTDNVYCDKANYVVKVCLPQNLVMKVDFEKINKE